MAPPSPAKNPATTKAVHWSTRRLMPTASARRAWSRGAQGEAERRGGDYAEQRHPGSREGERPVVVVRGRLEPGGRPHGEDAVVSARHLVPLMHDGVDDLGESESEHGEVDAREAHAEVAEERGARGRHERCYDEGERHGPARPLEQERRAVGAEAEIGGVTEGDHAAPAHEEMQARREEREGEDLDGHPHPEDRQHERECEEHDADDEEPARARRGWTRIGHPSARGAELDLGPAEEAPGAHNEDYR